MEFIESAVKKAFLYYKIETSQLHQHKLITNDQKNHVFAQNALQDELDICTDFFISVAFVTQSGLCFLKTHFADLARKGIRGRLMTSNYLGFNNPDVFRSLLEIENIDVRIVEKEGFHVKGYLFEQNGYHSLIIGSSNLTANALKKNIEWNVRLTSLENGEVLRESKKELERMWHEALPLTEKWVERYSKNWQSLTRDKLVTDVQDEKAIYSVARPNVMQEKALENLANLRSEGKNKGLVISATGTGKTYLSAFDVQQVNPSKMLFIVHREQILKSAIKTFKMVIGGADEDFGILSGNSKDITAKYLFATVQTISKPQILNLFSKNDFDYILIDEVHKAGAASHHKVIDYFDPKFLMGMTATSERTDIFNIFELFDYNIAYEIRLQEALEEDLLCPFHYFGVTDYEKDGVIIEETTNFENLVAEERVKFIIEKIQYYGVSRHKIRGLVFCSRKEEAKKLSEIFNNRGFYTAFLSGEDSISKREEVVERLENGELDYIFTVDIFNEGIDIPSVNQIIMLRNTQSSIIFIQQLGRGLRKHGSKDYVTIIDFIGNYKNNYMIPMALSGDMSYNKDSLRKGTFDTSYITGISSINFEAIAKERIYKAIDDVKLDSMKSIKDAYAKLKIRLNRVPMLVDFLEQKSIDPYLIVSGKVSNIKTYYDFLLKNDDAIGKISELENKYLMIISREFLTGVRKQDVLLLSEMVKGREFNRKEVKVLFQSYGLDAQERTIDSVLNTLNLNFFTGLLAETYSGGEIIEAGQNIQLSVGMKKALLRNSYFKLLLEDLLSASFIKSESYDKSRVFTLYKKYRRRDVIRLLNWDKQQIDQNIGGYIRKDDEFAIFITLKKGAEFSGAMMAYEDELLSPNLLKWCTKAPRTMSSPEVKAILDYYISGLNMHIFVKKSDDEGTDFYYLGKVEPQLNSIEEFHKPTNDGKTKSVVEMHLKFLEAVDYKLYRYLTNIE